MYLFQRKSASNQSELVFFIHTHSFRLDQSACRQVGAPKLSKPPLTKCTYVLKVIVCVC